jgi:hypothetical protein
MGGGHRPFSTFKVTCDIQGGLSVHFTSDEVQLGAQFTQQEDSNYFVAGKDYVVTFMPAGSGDLVGEANAESKPGG